jgi:hypothetical protein
MSAERKPWDLLPLFCILCQWITLAQILRLYQDRATVEWMRHKAALVAHGWNTAAPCSRQSFDGSFAWSRAAEDLMGALGWAVAMPGTPIARHVQDLKRAADMHRAWMAAVAADVLARLDGFDGPLPEPPAPPEPVVPEAPVTGPPTIAADLAPRTKAGAS